MVTLKIRTMNNNIFRKKILTCILFFIAAGSLANTYTVTKTIDDGSSGTLRWAITQANANAGYDVINFAILPAGNTFESSGANSWVVITVISVLPAITETVLIDGTTQTNTNLGFIAGRTVGVDAFVQGNINYPDVYIVCGYTLPNSESVTTGHGLAINAVGVTIRGLAISGFGNRSTTQATAVAHADIAIRYSTTARTMNTSVTDCFLSCDPRGSVPSPASRVSKSGSILILGNNNYGTIKRNYIAHPGGYGIVFHGTVDNTTASPNLTPSTNWLIEENQIINIGTNTTYTGGKAADGISMLHTRFCLVQYNYIEDWEQFGIDLGHNTDDNLVENNTLTGFIKTVGSAPCGGIRTAFSSERDTVSKNHIYNNTSTKHLAGIWTDETRTTFAGGVTKNNSLFYYSQNKIYDNINSGIVLSTNGDGTVSSVTMTKNSCYYNTGLGIDLNFTDLTGPTLVSVNDDGDIDNGTNTSQNFPIIDSAKFSANFVYVWGKAPANSTVEFFAGDGQWNKHGGLGLNYGEGKTYIGSAVEGSPDDGLSGTGSYNIDGNVATNNVNRFYFILNYSGLLNTDSITSTATLNGNTSEYGPKNYIYGVLGCSLLKFTVGKAASKTKLNWEAICDNQFKYFLVEHSTDGSRFSTIGKVFPDSVTGINKLSLDHFDFSSEKNFYRLKMVDIDGQFKYSQVVNVNYSKTNIGVIHLLQNPFRDKLSFEINLDMQSDMQVNIMDAIGNNLITKKLKGNKGRNSVQIPEMSKLPAGAYNLIVNLSGHTIVQNIIKQ